MAAKTTLQSSQQGKGAAAWNKVEERIKAFNIVAVRAQQQCFEEFQKETERLKESTVDESRRTWKEKLERKREEVEKLASDGIDKSFNEAAEYIRELPKEHQEAAASLFSAGTNEVAKAAQLVFNEVKDLIAAVDYKDFWNKVVMAHNAVESIISKAIGVISGKPPGSESTQSRSGL